VLGELAPVVSWQVRAPVMKHGVLRSEIFGVTAKIGTCPSSPQRSARSMRAREPRGSHNWFPVRRRILTRRDRFDHDEVWAGDGTIGQPWLDAMIAAEGYRWGFAARAGTRATQNEDPSFPPVKLAVYLSGMRGISNLAQRSNATQWHRLRRLANRANTT
jgi:hypothetical protein